MKKIYCLFFCFMLGVVSLAAQEVQVTNLKVAANKTITFDVSWGDQNRTTLWSDTVWVFIDYWNIDEQQMWRLPVKAVTLTSTWAEARERMIPGNNAGFYIEGNAKGTRALFTATVSVTPAGEYPAGVLRPCVYVTDYPPVAEYSMTNDSVITVHLAGTAPYSGVYTNGETWYLGSGHALNLHTGRGIAAFADATGNNGIVRCGNAGSSIKLTSATATQNQVLCKGSPLTLTSYTLSGAATSYTINKLPTGLTDTFDKISKVISISGTPTTPGNFAYTISTNYTAPCAAATISGTIRVQSCGIASGCPGLTTAGLIGTGSAGSCAAIEPGKIGTSAVGSCTSTTPGGIGSLYCPTHNAGTIGDESCATHVAGNIGNDFCVTHIAGIIGNIYCMTHIAGGIGNAACMTHNPGSIGI